MLEGEVDLTDGQTKGTLEKIYDIYLKQNLEEEGDDEEEPIPTTEAVLDTGANVKGKMRRLAGDSDDEIHGKKNLTLFQMQ